MLWLMLDRKGYGFKWIRLCDGDNNIVKIKTSYEDKWLKL